MQKNKIKKTEGKQKWEKTFRDDGYLYSLIVVMDL